MYANLIYAEGTREDGLCRILSGRSIAPQSGSEACLDLAQSWLKDCQEKHILCEQNKASPLPTRIICIESNPGDEELQLRLRTSENDERGSFAYLSYLWGSANLLRTTSSNVAEFLENIPINTIPKSWLDAIVVLRRMGLKYLWIDAMCIVQDSMEDKTIEITKMAHYASNATIVLAAGTGTDPYAGLFTARPNGDLSRLSYSEAGARFGSSHGVIRVRRPLRGTRDAILQTALARRAWTMQEAVLPERLLYYGSEQLYWNCQTHALSEGSTVSEDSIWNLAAHLRSVSKPPNSSLLPIRLNTWYELVQEYSARAVSFDADRLDGIATIAAIFHTEGGEYAAGLWRNDIHRGLLWKVLKQRNARPLNYIAPSWSWAAGSNRPIQYEVAKGIRLPVEIQNSANIVEIAVEHGKLFTPTTIPIYASKICGGFVRAS